MEIKVQKKELFNTFLLYLDPVLKLKTDERKILAAYLMLHYSHRQRYDNPYTLNDLMFMPSTKNLLIQKLSMPKKSFEKAFASLVQKRCIMTEQIDKERPARGENITTFINPALTQYPKDGKFKLIFEFKIID